MPGLLFFSLRLLIEALMLWLRIARRYLLRQRSGADRYEPLPTEPPPVRPSRPPRRRATPRRAEPTSRRSKPTPRRSEPTPPRSEPTPPRSAPTPPRSEPTRGEVAAMREAEREAETGGADSIGAEVHVAEPWPGYDGMSLDDLLTRLQSANEVELAVVRAYEREHEARQAVLLAAGEEV
jgi:hypothetical protein